MERTTNEQSTIIQTKPRNSFIAFVLSLVIPGLGQVYNGQPKKATIYFSLLLFFPFLFGVTRGITFFYGLLALVLIEIALRIFIVIDGVRHANRQKQYIPKPYNTWYYHLLIGAGMYAVLYVFDIGTVLGTRTFSIPSRANNPTFQVGDWLLADMRAYEKSGPDYGDIIAYSIGDGQIYTFRVVGLPNDNLELIDNIVSVNGKPGKARFIKKTTNDGVQVIEIEEELANGHKHLIYKLEQPYDITKTKIKNIVVPSDSYYVLGDNRDNAADSRYIGFISKDKIKGQIIYCYWGDRPSERMNVDFRDK